MLLSGRIYTGYAGALLQVDDMVDGDGNLYDIHSEADGAAAVGLQPDGKIGTGMIDPETRRHFLDTVIPHEYADEWFRRLLSLVPMSPSEKNLLNAMTVAYGNVSAKKVLPELIVPREDALEAGFKDHGGHFQMKTLILDRPRGALMAKGVPRTWLTSIFGSPGVLALPVSDHAGILSVGDTRCGMLLYPNRAVFVPWEA